MILKYNTKIWIDLSIFVFDITCLLITVQFSNQYYNIKYILIIPRYTYIPYG